MSEMLRGRNYELRMEPYNALKMLGKGTFGTVHLCERKHNKLKVVVKVISYESNDVNFKVAKNEVSVLKSLDHPNVIQYYDSFAKNNNFHIVMEYAKQGTLYEFINNLRGEYLSSDMVLKTFCQILLGVDHIHQKKIIHRDLKTENIFLASGNVVKIGDFGISKVLLKNSKANTSIGTTNYLAPEICDGQPYDTKSDIWSLGCILYELCEKQRMFDGPVSNIVLSIKSGNRKCVNLQRYSEDIQDIINDTIQINPENRPSTVNIMAFPIVFPTLHTFIVNLGNICN